MTPEELFKRLESKVDKIADTMVTVRLDLGEHMRRSAANEANLAMLRADFAPIKTHVAVVGAIVKGVGVVGTLIGIITALVKLAAL